MYGKPYILLICGRTKLGMLKLLGILGMHVRYVCFSDGIHLKFDAVSALALMCSKKGVRL